MLTRQKLWVPLLKVNPAFGEFHSRYMHQDPMSSGTTDRMGVTMDHVYVAMDKDRHGRDIAGMLAIACQIHGDACDDVIGGETGEKVRRRMSVGFASALSDTLNTYHIMGRLLPSTKAHVTVNMQSEIFGSRQLTEGTDVVVISTIHKMGKQLCYCTTDILHEPEQPSAGLLAEEANIKTYWDLQRTLRHYEALFHNSHVKAFMSLNLDQGGVKPAAASQTVQ